MVIGPHPVSGRSENVPMQDVEAKSDQNIEMLRLNDVQNLRRKSMDKLPANRLGLYDLDARQQGRTINKVERIVRRLYSPIESKILFVKDLLTKIWIYQSSRRFREDRIGQIGGFLRSRCLPTNQ